MIPAIVWQVAEPRTGRQKTVEILLADEVTYRRALIVGYGYGGVVRARYLDSAEDEAEWVDLTKEQYQWVV